MRDSKSNSGSEAAHHTKAVEPKQRARPRANARDSTMSCKAAEDAGPHLMEVEAQTPGLRTEPVTNGTKAKIQQNIRRYGVANVYWEPQANNAMCAMHAINGLLQRAAVDGAYLHEVASGLDKDERRLFNGTQTTEADRNDRPDGDYNIQVLQRALATLDGGGTLRMPETPLSGGQY